MVNGVILGKELYPPLHRGDVAHKKGAFVSPLTTVAKFTYFYLYIYLCVCDGGYWKFAVVQSTVYYDVQVDLKEKSTRKFWAQNSHLD